MILNVKLKILLPAKDAEIRLFCNGKLVEKKQNFELNYFVKTKGVYRVEIYYQGHAWIYSNHIRIL